MKCFNVRFRTSQSLQIESRQQNLRSENSIWGLTVETPIRVR